MPVHRTGPALSLCPTAFLFGLESMRDIVGDVRKAMGAATNPAPTSDHFEAALAQWPAYRRLLLAMDKDTWPASEPEGVVAILSIDRSNRRQWWAYDVQRGEVVPAIRPDLDLEQPANIDRLVESLPDPANCDEIVTCQVLGVTALPRQGARWVPWSNIGPGRA